MTTWYSLDDGSTVADRSDVTDPQPDAPLQPAAMMDEPQTHSWQPVDLVAERLKPPEPPTIGGLLYPGRRHVVSGEPEALKSWLLLVLAVEEMRKERAVMWLDFEMGRRETYDRLRALGLTDDEIRASFIYLEPTEPLTDVLRPDVLAVLEEQRPSLVVLDAHIGLVTIHALDPNKSTDVERLNRAVIEPLRSAGAAVVVLDHVVKDAQARGMFAIGSERKVGGTDVHLSLSLVHEFGRGRTGHCTVNVKKDRPGYLPRPKAAELELSSERTTGRVTWGLNLIDPETAAEPFRPTVLMERVSRHLEDLREPVSRTKAVEAVTGKQTYLFKAIDRLAAERFVTEVEGGGIVSVRPFREADDEGPVPAVPGSSRTVPGTGADEGGSPGSRGYYGTPESGNRSRGPAVTDEAGVVPPVVACLKCDRNVRVANVSHGIVYLQCGHTADPEDVPEVIAETADPS